MEGKNFKDLDPNIKEICESVGLIIESQSENQIKIFTDHATGLSLIMEIDDSNHFSYYFLQRTMDVVYNGDRTDIHVVMSLVFAFFLRLSKNGITTSLFDIPHPIVDDEIWGRYIVPEQDSLIHGSFSDEKLEGKIELLLFLLTIWRQLFWSQNNCPCKDCLKSLGLEDSAREYEIDPEFLKSIHNFKRKKGLNYGGRIAPNFSYYYDMKNEITVVKSIGISNLLEVLLENKGQTYNSLYGINGKLYIDGELKNYCSFDSIQKIEKIIKSLKKTSTSEYLLFPMENMILIYSKPYLIAVGELGGIREFNIEKEHLRNRHNKESELLFPITKFEWAEEVCPDQFEGMIKLLLEREPGVKEVRKPAPLNQGDKGRDLIIRWEVRDHDTIVSQTQPPQKIIKVVGQCKSSKSTIGKGKVLDIRDTLETHDSKGFFLAVSTQISSPVTEKLEDLSKRGVWTSWWNRDDIEQRLLKNTDLIPLFPKVMKPKGNIKFVEME